VFSHHHHLFTLSIPFRSAPSRAHNLSIIMAVTQTQLISIFIFSLILHLTNFALSINPNNLLLFPKTHRNASRDSRPAMILPLHLSPPVSSISSFNPRRQLQRSESQHHPNARMRLYDDLLINGLASLISSTISFRTRF
jgi:hypothetical protein